MRRWVSVKTRLPEEEQDVLMLFPHNMAVGFRLSSGWCTYSGDGYYTDCDFSDDPDSIATPTHWMPLPDPPAQPIELSQIEKEINEGQEAIKKQISEGFFEIKKAISPADFVP